MKNRRLSACALVVAALAACVSTHTVSLANPSTLVGKTIVVARRPMPKFSFSASSGAAWSLFGADVGRPEAGEGLTNGNGLVAEFHIEDPAIPLRNALLQELSARFHLLAGVESREVVQGWAPVEIAKANPGGDLVLDVSTVTWMAMPYPFVGSSYHMSLIFKAKLVLSGSGQLLAEATCTRAVNEPSDLGHYSEMVAEDGAQLKASIASKTQACLGELRTKLGIA